MRYKDTLFGKIPEDWEIKSISEITDLVTDYVANGSFKALAENVTYKENEDEAVLIRLVDYNNAFKGGFVFIDEHAYEFLKKSKLYGGEIIISNVGANVGTVFRCPRLPYKMSLGPNAIMVKFKENNDFYYFWLKSHVGQHMLHSIVTGSAQPKFNKTNFRDMLVPVPPRDQQDKIAIILQALEDKITQNNKINDNLYAQAKAIFEQQFIDLETIPDGWKKGNLLDIANYLNGLAMQKYRPNEDEVGLPVLKIKELRQGSCDNSSELCSPNIKPEYIIHDGDVIFSWSGSLLVDIWCGGTCGLNQHLFKVTSNTYDKWFYYLWTAHHLERFIAIAADKATTMGHIKRGELAKAEVLIPSDEDYKSINSLMNPIFNLIVAKQIEARKLAELRDELLPKLMSGEIDVSEVSL